MKVGKVSESVLKRSVLSQIKQKNSQVINGAGVGSDCAIFSCMEGSYASSVQTAILEDSKDIRYTIMKAVNGVTVAPAIPCAVLLSLLLPVDVEEKLLQDMMKEADCTAHELGIQIAGGHTEVSHEILKPSVTVTALGNVPKGLKKNPVTPGQDVVISKWIGLEGTVRLANKYQEKIRTRYPQHMIDTAVAYEEYLSVVPEAATAVKSNVSTLHDVSGGGIYAALWELAESAGVGLTIDLKKIPIKQETIEICEFFGMSPYELLSGGCLLMIADDGENLVQALRKEQICAVVVGKTTNGNDKVILNEEEKRYLERPRTDTYYQIKETMQ
ncbi:MAG TPA: AIR synthase-related protein [Lachnospiraceae bacterium]|nr:AIR synthase-related protein [Lachnospiraceae bacterium]